MDDILIDVGVYTPLEVDLTQFDFTGIEKVILTLKNTLGEFSIEREFSTPEVHSFTITPHESRFLRADAEYDFNIITTDGKRYKNGDNGNIILRRGCGSCKKLC